MVAGVLAACASSSPSSGGGAASGPVSAGQYRVQKGDTLYRIARRHGRSVDDLVRWNRLSNRHRIEVGQVLRVSPSGSASAAAGRSPSSGSSAGRAPASTQGSRGAASGGSRQTTAPLANLRLAWPAAGPVTKRFGAGNARGLTITNTEGTPISAAAAGTVAYAGSGLLGFGNLIILQHSGNYMTVYAHNRRLLVKEGQRVTQGQKIAEMGSSGASQVGLYFELRQDGKAIDPARALPAR
ncbi:peptidoglycan DD-metalloendopeptidase family protein [Corticimicrobacter populi]|uniref:Peptidase n=1 Tax=Corticimicrobacter populi TaxID=2175229 RepID=A0A2V1K244_9BURK|nr:peptidoglycan DD-metalloendopeptidase family protein [Corticimicrobacter populi]PWF23315.1 peptidase [Corticimicrobacter populi]